MVSLYFVSCVCPLIPTCLGGEALRAAPLEWGTHLNGTQGWASLAQSTVSSSLANCNHWRNTSPNYTLCFYHLFANILCCESTFFSLGFFFFGGGVIFFFSLSPLFQAIKKNQKLIEESLKIIIQTGRFLGFREHGNNGYFIHNYNVNFSSKGQWESCTNLDWLNSQKGSQPRNLVSICKPKNMQNTCCLSQLTAPKSSVVSTRSLIWAVGAEWTLFPFCATRGSSSAPALPVVHCFLCRCCTYWLFSELNRC